MGSTVSDELNEMLVERLKRNKINKIHTCHTEDFRLLYTTIS